MPAKPGLATHLNAFLLALFTGLFAPHHDAAAQGAFAVSPDTAIVAASAEFTVDILATTGGAAIDGAEVHLAFDTAYLEVLSLDAKGPDNGFPLELVLAAYDNINGTIDYGAFRLFPPFPTADFTLLSITFRARAAVPETALSFVLHPAFPATEMTGGGASVLSSTADGAIFIREDLLASPILFLQGAYDPAAGLMRDDLRANGFLPLGEPYSGLGYAHVGGGGETVEQGLFDAVGADAVVDWVVVELRDKSDSAAILASRSALLQRDGDVVDVDGTSPVAFADLPEDDYYLALVHRNHLGAMSAVPVALSTTATVVDLTASLANIFGGANGVGTLGDGNLGLYSGDFNRNGQVQNTDYAGIVPTLGTSGYVPGDFDLNGQVQNTDLQLKLVPNIGKGQAF